MSELGNDRQRDFSEFDKLPTSALEEILRADAQQLDDVSDLDAIFYITDLLEKRAQEAHEKTVDVEAQKKEFDALYLPFLSDPAPLHGEPEGAAAVPAEKPRRKKSLFFRTACVAAALAVLFLGTTVISSAFGVNIWGLVADWTDETFGFSANIEDRTKGTGDKEHVYATLQDALDAYGVTEVKAPTELPDGYVVLSVVVRETAFGTEFYATYANGSDVIGLSYEPREEGQQNIYERERGYTDHKLIGNVMYYLFENTKNNSTAWYTDGYECIVYGKVPFEMLCMVTESAIL